MINQIREMFATLDYNMMTEISLENNQYKAFAFQTTSEFGVCIPFDGEQEINERFSSVILKTEYLKVNDKTIKTLQLCCKNFNLQNEFANICVNFVKLGTKNEDRLSILENPYEWFEKWKELMGNRKTNLAVYDVIGEMKALLYLYDQGLSPSWNAMNRGTHDIDTEQASYEVKSTTKKKDLKITISSPHQLTTENDKELFLIYCKLEKSEHGESIEDLYKKLLKAGYNALELDAYLEEMGYNEGKSERYFKYNVLDMFKFKVDNKFPKLTFSSFIDGKLPEGVIHYTYTVDLANLEYERLN